MKIEELLSENPYEYLGIEYRSLKGKSDIEIDSILKLCYQIKLDKLEQKAKKEKSLSNNSDNNSKIDKEIQRLKIIYKTIGTKEGRQYFEEVKKRREADVLKRAIPDYNNNYTLMKGFVICEALYHETDQSYRKQMKELLYNDPAKILKQDKKIILLANNVAKEIEKTDSSTIAQIPAIIDKLGPASTITDPKEYTKTSKYTNTKGSTYVVLSPEAFEDIKRLVLYSYMQNSKKATSQNGVNEVLQDIDKGITGERLFNKYVKEIWSKVRENAKKESVDIYFPQNQDKEENKEKENKENKDYKQNEEITH